MPETQAPSYHGSFLMPSFEHATVAEAMHPGIVACAPETRLVDVARIMATHHVHCVVVMREAYDGSGEPYVWGIVSDLDLLRGGLSSGDGNTVGRLAQQPTISVRPSLPLRRAAELMVRHAASHLVVVHEETDRPIAVLSTLDVAGILAWGEG